MRPSSYILVIIFLITASCAPSRTFIDTSEQRRIERLNNQLKGKRVEIKLTDGNRLKSKNVLLTSDSLFYSKSKTQKSIPLTKIKFITTSPKFSISKIVAVPLFAAGVFSIVSFDDQGGFDELGKFYGGVTAIGLSGIILVIGNSIESEIYYFQKRN